MSNVAELSAGLKTIVSQMPASDRKQFDQAIRQGHEYLLAIRAGNAPASLPRPPQELLLAHSLLHDDPDGLLRDSGKIATYVGGDGQVYFGDVDYDSTDPKWAYTIFAWHETKGQKPPFADNPAVIEIPDTVSIALLGDWGGNNTASRAVATAASNSNPDYMIHLGDVYYAGTNESGAIEQDYERDNFLSVWPGKTGRSFALNSNHDMYAHGTGYFLTTLASDVFGAQAQCSYFALYNESMRVVGLDTAYFDKNESGTGFMTGDLGPSGAGTQRAFLSEQAALAAKAKQTLIVLSHHTGLSLDGSSTTPLWDQVVESLASLKGGNVIWYWGHEHIGAVYKDRSVNGTVISPRCCGHSCIPWGVASDLDTPDVDWYEKKVIGPGSNYFVANGYATLGIAGSTISETFLRQDGGSSWKN